MHNQLFVILDGTRADDLQILLQFMYRGEAYLHQDRINSVLRTAEVLQVSNFCQNGTFFVQLTQPFQQFFFSISGKRALRGSEEPRNQ